MLVAWCLCTACGDEVISNQAFYNLETISSSDETAGQDCRCSLAIASSESHRVQDGDVMMFSLRIWCTRKSWPVVILNRATADLPRAQMIDVSF